jgi:type IV pilus assembly protein PilQ
MIPHTDTRTANPNILVKNGQTAVIGGIYQSDSSLGKSGLPVLDDIPVLGWLFKSEQTAKTKNELLVFITPRILGQADMGISTLSTIGSSAPKDTSSTDSDIKMGSIDSNKTGL